MAITITMTSLSFQPGQDSLESRLNLNVENLFLSFISNLIASLNQVCLYEPSGKLHKTRVEK